MNKITLFALALTMAVPCTMSAQSQKELNKERNEVVKQSKKELNARVSKATKKEAKKLKKEGWLVSPGARKIVLPRAKLSTKGKCIFFVQTRFIHFSAIGCLL